jgi:hypothetical protein
MEQRLLDPPTQDRNNYSSVTNDFSLDEEKKFFVANIAFTVTPEQVQQWFSVRLNHSIFQYLSPNIL